MRPWLRFEIGKTFFSGRLCRVVSDGAAAHRALPANYKPHRIRHDGFRFLAVRQRKQVRIYSRGGHDWSERLPAITEALKSLPVRSVVLDGEGVICGPDGKSDFDAMRACFSRNGAPQAFL